MSVTDTNDFAHLPLSEPFLDNLKQLGYHQMTPIQAQSLPAILAGKDVLAQAKTGSGKTAAFGIGLLNQLQVRRFRVQGLILCPTRELADQVAKALRKLARSIHNIKILSLCGGTPFGPQIGSLEHGAHIVVGTPGRITAHLRKGSLNLDDVHTLILDEADRMLDMGFYDAIADIIEQTPSQRQTLLFSATYPDGIAQISARFMRNPESIQVESQAHNSAIEQHFFQVEAEQRDSALATLLGHYQPSASVIFCNTKRQCQDVANQLKQRGLSAAALHGDLDQRERDRVLVQFANQSCSVLVATDVAARGLDIEELPAVINYELSHDPEVHVHRVGRTGRAGQQGLALSLFSIREVHKLRAIEDYQGVEPQEAQLAELADQPIEQQPPMVTLCIDGGRKNKVRPGDILGALTGNAGIEGNCVGKIDIFDYIAYVAIQRAVANQALKRLSEGKIKGRQFKVRKLR